MENEYFDIDKDTVDRGWQSMQELLDRDMPVTEKRRRRFGFWWWPALFLASALTLGGTAWHFFYGENQTPAPAPIEGQKAQGPVASFENTKTGGKPLVKNVAPENLSVGTSSNSENKTTQAAPIAEKAQNSAVPVPMPQKSFVQKKPFSASDFAGANHVEKAPSILAANPASPQIATETIKIEAATASREASLDQPSRAAEATVLDAKLDRGALAALPALPALFVENQRLVPKLSPVFFEKSIKPQRQNRPAKWAFGPTLGLGSNDFPKLNNAFAGAVADWQPLRKCGLRMGLQVSFSRNSAAVGKSPLVSISSVDYFDQTQDTVFKNFINGSFTDPTTSTPSTDQFESAVVYLPLRQQLHMEAPILAFWQPFKKWRLYGGANVAYSLKAWSDDYKFVDSRYFSNLQSGGQGKSASDDNSVINNALSKWSVAWQAGIGFRPTQKWELNLLLRGAGKGQNLGNKVEALNSGGVNTTDMQDNPGGAGRWPTLRISGAYLF